MLGIAIATPFPGYSPLAQREGVASSSIEKRANPSISGLNFNINGVTQYFAGTNSYWIGFLTNDTDVDIVMNHLKSSGVKVLRIWGKMAPLHFWRSQTTYMQGSMMCLLRHRVFGFSLLSSAKNHRLTLEQMVSKDSTM